jgi:hypothetical protein
MKGPVPRVLIVDAAMRNYESDIRARLRPGVHMEFAHSTDAIAIARSAHLAGCPVSVIDRVDASARAAVVAYLMGGFGITRHIDAREHRYVAFS